MFLFIKLQAQLVSAVLTMILIINTARVLTTINNHLYSTCLMYSLKLNCILKNSKNSYNILLKKMLPKVKRQMSISLKIWITDSNN